MRLFLALKFREDCLQTLLDWQNDLRACCGGNFTRPENLHLTLFFLGETEAARLPELEKAFFAIPMPERLPLRFSGSGCFGRPHDRLIWLGLEKTAALSRLAAETRRTLAAAGFHGDEKPFRPHITMVRRADPPEPLPLAAPDLESSAESLCLFCSERQNGRLLYTPLAERRFQP